MRRNEPAAPHIRCPGIPSTVIRSFDYRAATRELLVEFVTGRRYVYAEVPEEEAASLRQAFAKGVYFNRHIRPHYAARELSEGA
jgi:hypothetical protein